MKIQKVVKPMVGINVEYPIPAKEEALNSRNLGGETVPNFPAHNPVAPVGRQRNTEGITKKIPLQVSRPGERRI